MSLCAFPSEAASHTRTCNSLEKMSAALMHVVSVSFPPYKKKKTSYLLCDAHVLQPPDYDYQRVSELALGWLGRTVTSVMYGMGIEAVGGNALARLGA